MKAIRLLFFFTLLLSAVLANSQVVPLFIGGQITQTPSNQPYPFHKVMVTIMPDTLNPAASIIDSTYTNISGLYSMGITVAWVPGTAIVFTVSTLDCQNYQHQQTFIYTGNSPQYDVDFSICGDSIQPPQCNNYFDIAGMTGHFVSLWGHMVNQQTATYSWNFGDGTTGFGEYITHEFPAEGIYSVTLSTVTSDSCMDATTQTVTVYDTIPPSTCDNYISIMSTSGLTVSMYGGMVNQQTASYSWSFGDGSAGSGVYVTHTYANQGTYPVTLTTVTNDSCVDVTTQNIIVFDSITPLPCDNYISINSIQGLNVSLYGGMINQQSASYSWSFGDGTGGPGAYVNHTYAAQGTYTITLTTMTLDSCMDVTYQTITVMDSIPGCSSYFTVAAGSGLYSIHFEGYTQSQYPTTYAWEFGDQATGTGQSVDHTYNSAGTYEVTLSTVDSSGCSSTSSAYVSVYMYGTLTLNGRIFADNSTITSCRVQLFSQDPTGTNSLVQEVTPDSANYYSFFNVASGIYRILAIPDLGTVYASQFLPTYFGDVFQWENATVIMLGTPANPYDIHLVPFDSIGGGNGTINGQINTGGKSILLANQEVLLLDNAGTAVRYTYTDGQGNYSFMSLPFGDYQVYPNITGITTVPVNVQLSVSAPNATVNMTIHGNTITGTAEAKEASLISSIYPNPVINSLNIVTNSRETSITRIEILDLSGRSVLQTANQNTGSGQQIEIQVASLSRGIYFLRIIDSKGNVSSQKFIKN